MVDIVARLVANGEALTATTGRSFAQVAQQGREAAKEIGSAFGIEMQKDLRQIESQYRASFANIKELAASVTQTNGSISIDVSGAKNALAEAKQRLTALQAVAQAAERVAAKESDATAATRAYIAASRDAVREGEEDVAILNAKVVALEKLQSELGQTAVKQNQVKASAGELRAGSQQLAFQISDVATSFASGINPMVIFAQQGSQVVQAIALMRGGAGGLVGFLAGPWGAAILGAVSVLGYLISAHDKSGEASEKHAKKEKTLTDRIHEQNEQLRENIQLQGQKLQGELRQSTQSAAVISKAISTTEGGIAALDAKIRQYEQKAKEAGAKGNQASAAGYANAARNVREERAKQAAILAELRRNLGVAEENQRIAGIQITQRDVKARIDPQAGETKRYEDALAKLNVQRQKGIITSQQYEAELEKIERLHAANAESATKSTKAQNDNNKAQKLSAATESGIRGENLLDTAKRYIGRSENNSADRSVLQSLFREANLEVDPKKTAWCAAFVNAVLAVNDLPSNGALNAQSFLTYGKGVNSPKMGDLVVLNDPKRGKDAGHVGFFTGYDKQGNIGVLGGNTDNKVGTGYFDRSRVMGFRRVPNADQIQAQNDKEQRQLEQKEEAYNNISKRLDEDLKNRAEAARIDDLRLQGLDEQADVEQAIADVRKRYSDILNNDLKLGPEEIKLLQDKVKLLEDAAAVEAKQEYDARQKAENEQEDKRKAQRAKDDYQRDIEDLANFYDRAFQSGGKSIWSDFKREGRRVLAELAAQATISLLGGNGRSGSSGGGLLGGLLDTGINSVSNLLGLSKSTGTQGGGGSSGGIQSGIGGATGLLNKIKIPGIGGLGDAAGAAMLAFTLFGGIFKKTKTGSATLAFNDGALGVGSTRGNSKSRIQTASDDVGSLADTLTQIADALGGNITGAGSVSIGVRKKKYVVDTTGQGRTKGNGVLSFADEKSAIEAALKDALSDGVIGGISAASQKILASGQNIEKAIEKASLIEAIPKALKARLDPVGAALDDLNTKWDKTIAALKEGGATAEQMADAEKLYRLEREDAMKAANDNLKQFIDSLNFGSSSPYSLLDQQKSLKAELDPILAKIAAGDFASIDQQKYLALAGQAVDISRGINGSGVDFFNTVDTLKDATQKLADGLAKGSTAASARDPFAEQTASNTSAMADILSQQSGQLGNIEAILAAIAQNGGGGSDFIGSGRNFMGAAA